MKRYSRAGEEGPRSDPSIEWTSHGVQTGVEASMWRLGLSGGRAGGGGGGGEAYPERSNEPDRGAAFAGTVQDVGLITREIAERLLEV
ncbi:zinc finger CCCH domain-containing protein 34 isoform X1 [Raphanus sativus]|uniref:Zinc finger CCCH domain-containing protein 34 isoform X1 n=1 Tax=Raphanus sativus TaxID=3726 RepID=A0A6J0L137_RAPSA|nr:zinc finger CCCH domain-containing protein 34 isoform X1 [Raphanus sativus]XP_018453164.1 PREDICTED: zinc finger CCCH domain-containing protein 34-like isoform X1 [Raphanus sativus]